MIEKNKKSKNQQRTLSNFIKPQVNSKLLSTRQNLERQIEKLSKIRKDIDKKKIEENKIITKILKLQLEESQQSKIEKVQDDDQEYWIFTEDQCSDISSNISYFKLILGDYGRPITNLHHISHQQSVEKGQQQNYGQKLNKENEKVEQQEQTDIKASNLCAKIQQQMSLKDEQSLQLNNSEIQMQIRQWRQNGLIKNQYLNDYQGDFLHYLKSMQYVADQLHSKSKCREK